VKITKLAASYTWRDPSVS